jgi:hypothetical protein
MDIGQLASRISHLEDLEAIRQLKARYCEICDADHDPDRIVTIFAADGVWEGAGFGRAEGHAAIRALFQQFRQMVAFAHHMVMNPLIDVDGDRARGTWQFLGAFTFREHNAARWVAVRYTDDYVRIGGEWLFQHLRAEVRLSAGPGESWAVPR